MFTDKFHIAVANNLTQGINKTAIFDKLSSFRFSIDEFHSYVTLLGVGVITGFICRRYFKLLVVSSLLAILVIKGLEKQSLLRINWTELTSAFGLNPSVTIEQVAKEAYELVIKNVYLSIAGFCGFLIGYRAG